MGFGVFVWVSSFPAGELWRSAGGGSFANDDGRGSDPAGPPGPGSPGVVGALAGALAGTPWCSASTAVRKQWG